MDDMDPRKVREQLSRKDKGEEGEGEEPKAASPFTSFTIDVKDARGNRYQGTFHFKVPSLGEQAQIARLKSAYLPQGAVADPNGALIVEAMSYLEMTLQEPRPAWWKPHEFYDNTPLFEVYRRARKYEDIFLGRSVDDEGRADSAAESNHSASTSSPDEGSVDEDVQPTRKRREVLVPHRTGDR